LYTFSIDNSDACLNESVDLLIIIISKSDNYKTRDAIRRTWASGKNLGIYSSINVKYFFLIDFNEKLSHNIRLENNLFHDIIQVELPQQYTLVTHRVLSLFEWSFRYCRTAKFLFKTDDDIFINLILLLKFISPLIKQPMNNSFLISDMTIYGYKHTNPPVFRYANDLVVARYIVTVDEFPCPRYPSFLSGFGYLIPKKARDAILYTAYQDPEPFRLSDVYLTYVYFDQLKINIFVYFFSLVVSYQIICLFHVNQCLVIIFDLKVIVIIFLIIQKHLHVRLVHIMEIQVMFFKNLIDIGNLLKRNIDLFIL
jgi:hypothetical protein